VRPSAMADKVPASAGKNPNLKGGSRKGIAGGDRGAAAAACKAWPRAYRWLK